MWVSVFPLKITSLSRLLLAFQNWCPLKSYFDYQNLPGKVLFTFANDLLYQDFHKLFTETELVGHMEFGEGLSELSQDGSLFRLVADGGSPQLDRILEGLTEPRSRRVLYALADDEPQSLDELARAVAEQKIDREPSTEQQKSVKVHLHHTVLPKLTKLRLIEYDGRTETVCFRDPSPELEEFLMLCRELDSE